MNPATATGSRGAGAVAPTRLLGAIGAVSRVYSSIVAAGPAARLLSHRTPVRHIGFEQTLRIERLHHEAEDVLSLTLRRADGSRLPTWAPGAHLDLVLPSGRLRQYSLCGDPADRFGYHIAVRRIADGGGGSREVHDALEAGGDLIVRGPRNAFTLIDCSTYEFVAGGIGITPILPMVRAAAAAGADWRLTYVGRARASMPFLNELQPLSADRIQIRPDDEAGPPDVAELLRRSDPGAAVYVCGPPPLVEAVRGRMAQLNPAGSLHTERFSARPVVGGLPFEIVLASSGERVPVAADETALAAIGRVRPDVVYSCRQGFCGTCQVPVLDGPVEHREALLTDAERTDSMLICVSRSVGGAPLVLDL